MSSLALVAAVIYPPTEIRDVVDQMAKHVARVGVDFEKKVNQKQSHKFKFQIQINKY
jgi:hypothetical protein